MTLIAQHQLEALIENARAALKAREQGSDVDLTPVVRLFTPEASCTWLLTELDPDDLDRAFGLCDLGQGFPELGYVSLREIQSLRDSVGVRIERDLSFSPDKPLSAYAEQARTHRRIIA